MRHKVQRIWNMPTRGEVDLDKIARFKLNGVNIGHVTVVTDDGKVYRKPYQGEGEWQEFEGVPWHDEQREKSTMKVLVFTPLHPAYGIRPQSWKTIKGAIENYDGEARWEISYDNPSTVGFENVAYQHNLARQKVLDGDYDALLSLEADMIVPHDTIQGLIECDSDIAYGLYVWRGRKKRWNAYREVELFGGWSLSMYPDEARAAWGTIRDVAGLGMGVTLIKRHVLERLEFRLYDGRSEDWILDKYGEQMAKHGIDPYRPRTGMFCDDWLLAMEAQHYGFSQRCNFNVVCGHISKGEIVWPDIEEKEFYRIEQTA